MGGSSRTIPIDQFSKANQRLNKQHAGQGSSHQGTLIVWSWLVIVQKIGIVLLHQILLRWWYFWFIVLLNIFFIATPGRPLPMEILVTSAMLYPCWFVTWLHFNQLTVNDNLWCRLISLTVGFSAMFTDLHPHDFTCCPCYAILHVSIRNILHTFSHSRLIVAPASSMIPKHDGTWWPTVDQA